DPGGEVVLPDQDVLEIRVARGAVDLAVHLDVAAQELAPVVDAGLELGHVLRQLGEAGAGGGGGGDRRAGRRERLQLRADLRDVGEVGDVDRGGERAAPGVGDDEPVAFEALERLAHRGAPGAELLGERLVVERVARADVEHDQAIADALVGLVRERSRPGQLRCETHVHPLTTFLGRPTVHRRLIYQSARAWYDRSDTECSTPRSAPSSPAASPRSIRRSTPRSAPS